MVRRYLRLLSGVAVLLLLTVSVAACGTEESAAPDVGSSSVDAATVAATDTESATPAADAGGEMPDVVRIGLIPGENSEDVLKRYRPIEPWLEEQLGTDVELFIGTDYSATIEALKSGRVDAAFLNPFGYILAVDQGAAELLLGPMDPETGELSHYHSTIVTRADSDIQSLEDLRGKDFGFVDPASTSGHLIPEAGLKQAGIDPWTDMKPVYAGGHDVTALSVYNGTLPAAAVYTGTDENNPLDGGMIDRLAEAGQVEKDAYRVLWVSDPIPSGPFVVRPDAPQVLKDRLKAVLLQVNDTPEMLEVLGEGYIEATDDYWDVLRDAAKLLGLDLKELVNEG